jgi:hypothetical protein
MFHDVIVWKTKVRKKRESEGEIEGTGRGSFCREVAGRDWTGERMTR